MKNNRRSFLRNAAVLGTGLYVVPNLISCKKDDNPEDIPSDLSQINFDYGVASFDPNNDGVIIWTRYSKDSELVYQISTDKTFTTVDRTGTVQATSDRDYTVSVEVKELGAGKKLYYRFINKKDKAVSVIGETITIGDNPESIKMAICSCSNYQAGIFNVYKEMSNTDADIVLHLGDYFYEYEKGGYGYQASLNRGHLPENEIISLDDYRERYKQYRSDADLMKLHQLKPFICIWDDHEITNDTYKDGAENHNEGEGSFDDRKKAAIRAYSEYLPVSTSDENIIYRTLKFGSLMDLIMLDTRVIGRDKQLEYADYISATGQFDAATFQADLLNPNRTILGSEQKQWLFGQLAQSTAQYQVLGQQVLMGKMMIPIELITLLGQIISNPTPEVFVLFNTVMTELVTIKSKKLQGIPITAEEEARIANIAPYNLDAWDGYPVEREEVYYAAMGKNLVVLAGDTHNGWYTQLTDQGGNKVGMEVAVSSVTSPGLEELVDVGPGAVQQFEYAMQVLMDDLQYLNASDRGFVFMEVSNSGISSSWIYVDTVLNSNYSILVNRTKESYVTVGA